jgi:hypothetical protein
MDKPFFLDVSFALSAKQPFDRLRVSGDKFNRIGV